MSDDVLAADSLYQRRMEQGSVWLRDAIALARANDFRRLRPDQVAPAALRWFERPPPVNWQPSPIQSDDKLQKATRLALRADRAIRAERQRVSRDPCPYCAVRGDIGCKHRERVA